MRILITTGIFPPDIGGPAGYVPRIAKWLLSQGHQVHVVCWSDEMHHDDGCYPFPVTRVSRRDRCHLRFIRTLRAIYTAGRQADIWFVNGLPTESQLLATLLGKKTLHKIVGDIAWERAVRFRWFSGTIDAFQTDPKDIRCQLLALIRSLPVRMADRVMVPSRYLGSIVKGWGIQEQKIAVIYNSTSPDPATVEVVLPQWTGPTLLTICRLAPWKGVDRLLTVVATIPGLRLVVLGDGPMREQLENLAQRLGVVERVIFMGQLPKNEVQAVLRQCSLFVLNSTYEGLPHVVLEAMMASIPVIATRVGGTPEVVIHKHTGLLVNPQDDDALRTSIMRLMQDTEQTIEFVRKAHDMLKEYFDQETCFKSTERLLEEISA